MTRLWNDPADFADEMIDGFVAANGRYVRRVPGGVVRSTVIPDGQVSCRDRRRIGSLPRLRRTRRPGPRARRGDGQSLRLPLDAADRVGREGSCAWRRGLLQLRQLRRRCAQLRRGAGSPPCRGDRLRDRHGHRRHLLRRACRDAQAARASPATSPFSASRPPPPRPGYDLAGVDPRGAPRERTHPLHSASRSPAARCPVPRRRCSACPRVAWRSGLGIHGEPGIEETGIPTADGLAELLVARLLAELPDDVDARGSPCGADPQRPRLAQVRGDVRRLPAHRRSC